MRKIRYIIDESFGSTNDAFNTSWIEIQALNKDGKNVAVGATVKSNFIPLSDVTGQAGLDIITNNKITQGEYVSVNVAVAKELPVKVIIDLGRQIEVSQLRLYHGWWTRRAYKNRIYVANNLNYPELVYDYQSNGLVFESRNEPMTINL